MAAPAAKWQETLMVEVVSDPYVTGKHGFELWGETMRSGPDEKFFESGLVYSTRDDAERAGEDAAHAAWKWRNR